MTSYQEEKEKILRSISDDRISSATLAEASLLLDELVRTMVIGEDEAPKPNPKAKDIHEQMGTCWGCYEEDYCTHAIRDEFRDEQRQVLDNPKREE